MKPVKIMLLVLFAAFCRSSLACKCSGYFDRPMQLEDLKDYDFIALVRVTDEHDIKSSSQTMTWSQSLLNIEILEQFKGEKFRQIIENGVNSSCNMGVDAGEEWVVFATLVDGTPAVSPCRRNVQFKAKDGQRDWQFQQGFRQLSELRSLYGHPTKPKSDGIYLEHYPSGKVELEEHYVNGLKNGKRTVYYANGGIYGQENFLNDSLQGESCWYYPSGQLFVRKHFGNGRPRNVTKVYYDSTIDLSYKDHLIRHFYKTEDSLRFVYNRVQIQYETVFDSFGREIAFREFSRLGNLQRESIYNPDLSASTEIFYHENGNVKGISFTKDNKDYGHYQEYDKNGAPSKSWDYDEEGRQIKASIWIKK